MSESGTPHTTLPPSAHRSARTRTSAEALRSSALRRWSFFGVVSLGLLMIGLDNSILYTALPTLSEQLHASSLQQLWIINAYALMIAGLLLGTGTLGDRIGHRRMFVIGLWIFGLASLTAALAPGAWELVAARAFLGIGASIMMPATLALIRLTFEDEIERNTAIGIWGSIAVVGAAAGPTVGGFPPALLVGLCLPRQRAHCPPRARAHAFPRPAQRGEPGQALGFPVLPVRAHHPGGTGAGHQDRGQLPPAPHAHRRSARRLPPRRHSVYPPPV